MLRPATRWLPLGALLAFAAVAATFRLRSYDLFWHLAAGRWILARGAVPRSDPLRFTSADSPWIDHAWLFQVLAAAVERAAGLEALVAVRALIAVGIAGVLLLAVRRAGAPDAAAVLVAAGAVFGARSRLMMRPEIASVAGMAVLLLLLSEFRRSRRPWTVAGMAALAAVWANVHPGVLATPFVAAAFLLGCRLPGGRGPGRGGESVVGWGAVAGIPLLLALSTLANPYGARLWTVPLAVRGALDGIPAINPEWLPLWSAPQPVTIVAAVVMVALLGASLAAAGRVDPATGMAALLALALAVSAVRHQALFFVAAAFLAGESLADVARRHAPARPPGRAAVAAALGACLAASAWCVWPPPSGPLRPRQGPYTFGVGLEPGRFPVRAAEVVLARDDIGPLYNDVAFGGYLAWRLWPQRVFIDGRNEVDPSLLREVASARSDSRAWSALLERHGIDGAVVRYDDRRIPVVAPRGGTAPATHSTPNALLFPRSRFALVHWDDVAMVLVRRTAERATLLDRDEYRFVHPEDRDATLAAATADAGFLAGALAEVDRRLAEDPACARAGRIREDLLEIRR